jgi:UPF0271 protein
VVRIDLNSDLGEGFGAYRCGDDEKMISVVTSANVACGMHAGDPEIMAQTFLAAKERNVAVGAHPGFPDLWGFGRRRIPFSTGEIERLVAYQIGAAQALAVYSGHRITYVKAHGALGNISETERNVADAIAGAIRSVDPSLALLAIALSEQVRAGEAKGLLTISEAFADRAYTEQGRLVPRRHPGAIIEDPQEVAQRALAMVESGALITVSGVKLKSPIGSVCVHGDTPQAASIARYVRTRFEDSGMVVEAFAPP